jgi:sporulation protein YlmC with PRC-barrel domain
MIIDSGQLVPSPKQYKVINSNGHRTLNVGDIVVATETPNLSNMYLIRVSDMTLHDMENPYDDYIYLESID